MENVKIITINTWKCDGEYRVRMGLLAKQLEQLNPHVVACQECFYSEEGNADTLKFLANELNMNYVFLPGRSKKRMFEGRMVKSTSGLGILSVYPLNENISFDLPVVAEDNDRKAFRVNVNLPSGKTLTVTTTHLTHLGQQKGLRKAQAEALASFVIEEAPDPYHIICGDFNATPDSEAVMAFRELAKAVDCYTAGNGTEPHYSLTDAYYKANKQVCIDHIFTLQLPGTNKYPQFIDSAVVLNVPDEATGLYPSDHFGITTTLLIP
ncbi:Metal-dependent hydrolase, endonuclease/exonuclease/phosphatase family [Mucilaginibacter gossypiicola]|uniref:Metal-dependent hydrolase, endonuclease/exonuclease/phosphatase family n=1 Tax=Mucilaginibacter gossypiicola TaxID=551995 RepID=A0A1H8HVT5_9SPHI|nr:endonuclease/exonuclease/phosphatase family protein [Mucilaginibacter gossypiicola]SEN60232.1 Metal-dependent hydrolase, endonuclease/exonuclease/phosphatase family [Mucilaginibacter gossypiicola]